MLGSAATIEMLAQAVTDYKVERLVLDPVSGKHSKNDLCGGKHPGSGISTEHCSMKVMVATTGAQLLPTKAVNELRTLLLPLTFILTPNIPEAKILLTHGGEKPQDVRRIEDLENLARRLQALGPRWVLVKGGHVPFKKDGTVATSPEQREIIVDVLLGPDGNAIRIEGPYVDSKNTHGTGCSLASAIAANLARGLGTIDAVRAACQYVEAAIRTAPGYGKGHGPLNHFHSTYILPFAP